MLMRTSVTRLVVLASLLIDACSPLISTPTPSPSLTPNASAPTATASAVASTSPIGAPDIALQPPVQHLDQKTLFVVSYPDLLRSDDDGKTWTVVRAPQFARFDELRMI